jgi:hypothetical protein
MAKEDWPKSYVIPALALTVTAASFLVWHVLDPARHIDGWAIALLVVGFLPWLRTVFESIEFPGGGSVTWRKMVEREQERQARDIEALQFLTANFLPGAEYELLQALTGELSVPGTDFKDLQSCSRALTRKGLIAIEPGIPTDAVITNVGEQWVITEKGRQYLDLAAKLAADE